MIRNQDIKDLINEIEVKFPVNDWRHNGYAIWPIIRIRLFFEFKKKQVQRPENYQVSKSSNSKRKLSVYFSYLSSIIKYYLLKKPLDKLYCGAPSHRVDYMEYRYNRYFDKEIDKLDVNSVLFEYKTQTKNKFYKPKRVVLFEPVAYWFKLIGRNKNEVDLSTHVDPLIAFLNQKGHSVTGLKNILESAISTVDLYIFIWEKILKNLKPKEVHVLCYYSSKFYALNIVASRLDIKTIDMQHGPQNEFHLAYGSWFNIPKSGYEALPDVFYTWDKLSAINISNWAKDTSKHSVKIVGNPWVEGWKEGIYTGTNFEYPKKLILYTLQPIGEPLEDYLLEVISKTKINYNWWLRVHPRQLEEINSIKDKLNKVDLLSYVNITDATNLPLPEILAHTKLHITKSSGCAIEAMNFDVPTIIISKGGWEYYKDYMQSSIMDYSLTKNSFDLIKEINKYI